MTGSLPLDLPPDPAPPWASLRADIEAIERPVGGFSLILADPPWKFVMRSENGLKKAPERHYDCVPTEIIAALPIWKLAAPDSVLLLWGTGPMLVDQLGVLKAWGFEYRGFAPWFKGSPKSEGEDCEDEEWKAAFGLGYLWRSCSEIMLVGTRGQPKLKPERRKVRGAFFDPQREHSRKPDDQYTKAEALIAGPYLELFSRSNREGWTAFGNHAGRFGGVA